MTLVSGPPRLRPSTSTIFPSLRATDDTTVSLASRLDEAKPAEQKLVLEVLKLHPSLQGLQLAVKAGQLPGLKEDANQASLAIAQKLGGRGADVNKILAAANLERVRS